LKALRILKGLANFAGGEFAPSLRGGCQKSLKRGAGVAPLRFTINYKKWETPEGIFLIIAYNGFFVKGASKCFADSRFDEFLEVPIIITI